MTLSYPALSLLAQAESLPYNDTPGKIERYEMALQHDADIELAHAQLGNLYRISRAIKRSVLHYKKAIECCQNSAKHRAEYATEAGNACAVLGESEFATQWWQRAIHFDPTLINPYLNLAHLFEEKEAFDDAEQYLMQAQKFHPEDYRCYFSLARIYSKTASWNKAIEQYQRQIAMGGDDPWCHSDVATCYLQMGDTEKAQYHLAKTAEMDPDGEAGEYARLILVGLGV
jgi:tetratricopeptide (TPR) repeat protein